MLRGTIGWFKSEPLGLFYGLLGLYFFLSGIKSKNKKIAVIGVFVYEVNDNYIPANVSE